MHEDAQQAAGEAEEDEGELAYRRVGDYPLHVRLDEGREARSRRSRRGNLYDLYGYTILYVL